MTEWPENPRLLYLHGFNSSPASMKARLTEHWLKLHYPEAQLHIPALPFSPRQAIKLLEAQFFSSNDWVDGIIGSSLGGYYATYLASKYQIPAVLVNPAVRPYDLLDQYLGVNQNLYTGETYQLTHTHMQELLDLKIEPSQTSPLFLVLLQTGDATLDYHQAVDFYRGQSLWIIPGGNHEFEHYDRFLPATVNHFVRFHRQL